MGNSYLKTSKWVPYEQNPYCKNFEQNLRQDYIMSDLVVSPVYVCISSYCELRNTNLRFSDAF